MFSIKRLREVKSPLNVRWSAVDAIMHEEGGESTSLWKLGDYQLLERLGEGAVATVYSARHLRLNRTVVVKLLREKLLGDPKAMARFRREMAAVGGIEHPHIVWASDAGEHEGAPYIVMEHLEGRTLDEVVRSRGPLPIAAACELARQTALGLTCIQEHQLVHRDIKPANLFLTASGQVKILDLGLARFKLSLAPGDEVTEPAAALGTLDYMAPEQAADSRHVDIRADLYSLGCTLFELLTARPPFADAESTTAAQKLLAHAQRPAPPLRELRRDVPAPLAALVEKLLAKNPGDRIQTPQEAALLLTPLATGHDLSCLATGVNQQPTGLVPKPPLQVRTRKLNRTRIVWALGTLVLAGIVSAALWNRPRNPIQQIPPSQPKPAVVAAPAVVTTSVPAISAAPATKAATLPPADPQTELAAFQVAVEKFAREDAPAKTAQLRQQLANYSVQQVGRPEQISAAALIAKLIAPVDLLQPAAIPREEQEAGGPASGQLPAEVVAVFGDSRLGHWNSVRRVAFNTDGSMLATPGEDSVVRVWDTRTSRLIARLQSNVIGFEAARFLPDGKTLVTASGGGGLRYWDTTLWRQKRAARAEGEWAGHWDSAWMDFSPDGTLLAVAAKNNQVLLVDVNSAGVRQTLTGPTDEIYAVAFSSGGALVAAGDKSGVASVWNAVTGAIHKVIKPEHGEVRSVALSADGTKLATGHADKTVCLWDLAADAKLHTIQRNGWVPFGLAFSHSGELLAVGDFNSQTALYSVVSGELARPLHLPSGELGMFPVFSPSDKLLACGLWNSQAVLWDVAAGASLPEQIAGHLGPVLAIAASPDGQWLASGGVDRTVRVWNMESGSLSRTITAPGSVVTLAFLNSTSLFVGTKGEPAATKTIAVWDVTKGSLEKILKVTGNKWYLPPVAMNAAGTLFANTDDSNAVHLWELVNSRERHVLRGHEGQIEVMALSLDGQSAASGGRDRRIRLWNTQSGEQSRTMVVDPEQATALAYSPDGKLLAVGLSDTSIHLYATVTGDDLGNLRGHDRNRYGVFSLAFSPSGDRLASTSGDGTVRLWDCLSHALVKTLLIGTTTSRVRGVTFTPDGRHLATANENGTVYVLRLESK